jgi:hypothetical protein
MELCRGLPEIDTVQNCPVLPCPDTFDFQMGLWSPCSVTCGAGLQRRQVHGSINRSITPSIRVLSIVSCVHKLGFACAHKLCFACAHALRVLIHFALRVLINLALHVLIHFALHVLSQNHPDESYWTGSMFLFAW